MGGASFLAATARLKAQREVSVCVHLCARARVLYLTASCGVVTPVSSLTPVTGGSLCVGGAGTLAALRVTVPSSVITGACWEERESSQSELRP